MKRSNEETQAIDFQFDRIFAKFLGDHDLTMAQVAHDTNISYTTINSWQKGKATPKFDQVVKLCMTYKVSPEYFCGLTTKEEFQNVEYISKYTGLSVEAIENLHNGLKEFDSNEVEAFLNDDEFLIDGEKCMLGRVYDGLDILISNPDKILELNDSLSSYFAYKKLNPNHVNDITTIDNSSKKMTRRFKGKNSWLVSVFLTDIISIIQKL